jgi:hypothetical protein
MPSSMVHRSMAKRKFPLTLSMIKIILGRYKVIAIFIILLPEHCPFLFAVSLPEHTMYAEVRRGYLQPDVLIPVAYSAGERDNHAKRVSRRTDSSGAVVGSCMLQMTQATLYTQSCKSDHGDLPDGPRRRTTQWTETVLLAVRMLKTVGPLVRNRSTQMRMSCIQAAETRINYGRHFALNASG